jgi:hypothetical protein
MAKKLSRNIKPREKATAAERQLRQPQEDGPSTFIPSGDYTINPTLSGVRLERFSSIWSKEGSSASFRVWNHLDEKDPENNLYRGRLGPRMDELGGMSMFGPVVVAPFVGLGPKDVPNGQGQKSTFIVTKDAPRVRSLKWKKNVTDVLKENVPFWELPYPSFYDACKNAFKAGKFASGGPRWDSEWNSLMDNSDGKAPIVDMKTRYFVVGHFYELGPDFNTQHQTIRRWDGQKETTSILDRKGVPYGLGDNDPLVVAWMSGNAGEKVLDLCKTLKDEWSGDEEANPALPYKYGDPCGTYNKETGGVDGGLIFTMFNPEMYQPENHDHSTWDGRIPSPSDFSSYQVSVSRSYTAADGTKFTGDMAPEAAQKIFDKNLYPWAQEGDESDSTLLHEATVEEEAVLVAKGFADVPKLVEFAWTSHPEYLEFDEVQSVLRKRTSVSMPESAFEDDGPGTGMFETLEEVPVPSAPAETPTAVDEFDEETGGELEAEAPSAADDTEFDEFAQSFVSDGSFEEDEGASAEFDPEKEADELSESMGESLSKASKALAKSAKRSSPKRKLNPRS